MKIYRTTSLITIGAAQDVKEILLKRSEGLEPRFISRNVVALHTFDFTFPEVWSRKKIKPVTSKEPEVYASHWNDVYSQADDQSRLKWLKWETVVMAELGTELRGGIFPTAWWGNCRSPHKWWSLLPRGWPDGNGSSRLRKWHEPRPL